MDVINILNGQVEDTHHEKQQDDNKQSDEDKSIKQEKEGIEMTDDFEGKK